MGAARTTASPPEEVVPLVAEREMPPTSVHQARTKKGAERRAAIVAAASELFLERGYRATSLDDIGARAGISGPAIYRYFASKQELLMVLLEDAAVTWRRAVDEVLSADDPPLVTLERLIDAAVALELKNGNLRALHHEEPGLLDDDARRRLARLDRVTMAEWTHLLCEVRPGLTDEEARAAVVMVEGILRSVSRLHGVDRDRLAGVIKDMVLGGVLALGGGRSVVVASG